MSMNRLSKDRRARVVAALVEGNSIRSTVRMTGVAKGTVLKLLADLRTACANYHDQLVRDLHCKRIQCDEIWSFCYAKEKNGPENMKGQSGVGDVWTWTAWMRIQSWSFPGLLAERTLARLRSLSMT